MKKPLCAMIAAALSLSCFTACGTPTSIVEEPYEAVEYSLYPAPADCYVGDTMPFVHDGKLEFYYLYDTDHNGQCYHPIYKYTTEDFTSYEDNGMALEFGTPADPDPALGTGSVMQDQEGLYHLFYTGHSDGGNGGKGKECVMHATSTDCVTWTKCPEDTFWSEDNYSKDDFRDPEVFWVEEEQCYWLLIAARENSKGGVVARYTSTDLKNWTICDPLFAPNAQYMLECPDIIHLGDKYYLTYSWDCVTYYAVADSMIGPYKAPADNVLDGNGFIFYAAKTVNYEDTPYLCGWLGRAGFPGKDSGLYQWAGSMLNHELVQREDGSLGVKAPHTFADYFTQLKEIKPAKKEGNTKIAKDAITLTGADGTVALADLCTRPATMMLECDVTINGKGAVGFAFGGTEKDPSYTALCLDTASNMIHYEGTPLEKAMSTLPVAYTNYDFSQTETHHLTLVCENEIVVLYVDDAKVLSNRIYRSTDGAHIGVFAQGADAVFTNLSIKTH